MNANFFRAVDIEKRMMFLIVFLIIAVAAFNIVSSLFMAVKDKQSDIAILRTLGASPGSVMKIFLIQGTLIGLMGTFLGVAGGVALASTSTSSCRSSKTCSASNSSPRTSTRSAICPPSCGRRRLRPAFFSFVVSLLATIYPSYRAAKINPAEALRYE